MTVPILMGTQASEHGVVVAQQPRMIQSIPESAAHTNHRVRCMICHSGCCELLSHRLLMFSILRRVARSGKKEKLSSRKANQKAESMSTDSVKDIVVCSPAVLCAPVKRGNKLDHFISFPVEGVNRNTIQLFHSFFTSQGSSLLESQRNLNFDSAYYPYLYPAACQNSALAMSLVAMSATFHGTQIQDLMSPSHELLGHYNRAFEELRKKIEVERAVMVTESTIMAAINLCMCCGISFGDSRAALFHWQGILALLDQSCPILHSGAIIGFINHIEHWLVLTADYKPRSEVWPILIRQEKQPPQKYGQSLETLYTIFISSRSSLSHELLELSTNTCMATELLESHAAASGTRGSSTPSTYYIYLRGVVAEQGAILYSKLRYAKDLDKYISLTLSIYYVVVLRRSPWKAPLHRLYTELKGVLPVFTPDQANNQAQWRIRCENKGSGDDCHLEQSLYIWMLLICACAAKICRDQSTLESLGANLDEVRVLYKNQNSADWESALVQDLGKLVWSDTFLTGHLRAIWASRNG